ILVVWDIASTLTRTVDLNGGNHGTVRQAPTSWFVSFNQKTGQAKRTKLAGGFFQHPAGNGPHTPKTTQVT
ncbi:MAG TPA: hypothetical protein VLL94_04025, partial [Nitrospiraceae bacterium]|nr:hypothetical protein [Nitrospiraceae bacterium]